MSGQRVNAEFAKVVRRIEGVGGTVILGSFPTRQQSNQLSMLAIVTIRTGVWPAGWLASPGGNGVFRRAKIINNRSS